ncbi:MAG: Bax inhibitor-1 family protein, partial [Victivallaceae bacterium]
MQNFYNQMAEQENVAAVIQAQNSFISKVFGWMTVGLAVTGAVAYYISTQRELLQMIFRPLGLILLIVGLLGLVWYLNRAIERLSVAMATFLFVVYAAFNGVFLASVFLVYTMQSIGAV